MKKNSILLLENNLNGIKFNEHEIMYFNNLIEENNNNISMKLLIEFFDNIDTRILCTSKNINDIKYIYNNIKKKN